MEKIYHTQLPLLHKVVRSSPHISLANCIRGIPFLDPNIGLLCLGGFLDVQSPPEGSDPCVLKRRGLVRDSPWFQEIPSFFNHKLDSKDH